MFERRVMMNHVFYNLFTTLRSNGREFICSYTIFVHPSARQMTVFYRVDFFNIYRGLLICSFTLAIPAVSTTMTSSTPHPVTSQRELPSICADIDCFEFANDVIAEATIETADNKSHVDDDDDVIEQITCPPDSIYIPTINEISLLDDRARLCCEGVSRPRRRSQSPTPSTDSAGNRSTSTALCRCLPCPSSDEEDSFDECPVGQVRVLKVDGRPDTPGQCCDVYECIDHGE